MVNYEQMLSDRVKITKPSGIRRFFEMAAKMPHAISLGVGEPDFETPWQIRRAGIQSLEKGQTFYTSNWGLAELRSQIAALALDAVGTVDLLAVQIHVGLHIQQTLFIGLIGANTPAGFVSTFDSHWYYHPFLCSQKKCVMGAKVILFVSVTLY